jgi:type II secretory pathway pseudopilin PulG
MAAPRPRRDGGFTYLSLIILVAIIGLVSASALKLGSVIQRSRAEQELLVIGAAFSDALQSYADATPAGMPTQPPSLNALLKDARFPGVRRHLRKVFVDPMTGKAEWGIVYLGDKVGVLAVYSLSDAKPVKIGNFPQRFEGLAGKQKLSEWRFAATGKPGAPGVGVAPIATPGLPPAAPPSPATPPAPVEEPPSPPQEPPPEMPEPADPVQEEPPAPPAEPPAEPQPEIK